MQQTNTQVPGFFEAVGMSIKAPFVGAAGAATFVYAAVSSVSPQAQRAGAVLGDGVALGLGFCEAGLDAGYYGLANLRIAQVDASIPELANLARQGKWAEFRAVKQTLEAQKKAQQKPVLVLAPKSKS